MYRSHARAPDYYAHREIRSLESIDPLFRVSVKPHASRGKPCRCGHTVIAVDGEGTMRRCHFIREPVGNIYQPDFDQSLSETPCTNETCGCHIGYVHLRPL